MPQYDTTTIANIKHMELIAAILTAGEASSQAGEGSSTVDEHWMHITFRNHRRWLLNRDPFAEA